MDNETLMSPQPLIEDGVPYCYDQCPNWNARQMRMCNPRDGAHCGPAVRAMSEELERLRELVSGIAHSYCDEHGTCLAEGIDETVEETCPMCLLIVEANVLQAKKEEPAR